MDGMVEACHQNGRCPLSKMILNAKPEDRRAVRRPTLDDVESHKSPV